MPMLDRTCTELRAFRNASIASRAFALSLPNTPPFCYAKCSLHLNTYKLVTKEHALLSYFARLWQIQTWLFIRTVYSNQWLNLRSSFKSRIQRGSNFLDMKKGHQEYRNFRTSLQYQNFSTNHFNATLVKKTITSVSTPIQDAKNPTGKLPKKS